MIDFHRTVEGLGLRIEPIFDMSHFTFLFVIYVVKRNPMTMTRFHPSIPTVDRYVLMLTTNNNAHVLSSRRAELLCNRLCRSFGDTDRSGFVYN